jgi:Spy/CpxP family protein refolding chaperone
MVVSSLRATRVLALVLLSLLVPSFVCAQIRANLPWWNSPVVGDLGLSSEQTQRIRQIVRTYRSRLLDARNNANKAEQDLEDVFNDAEVNSKAADPVISRVAAARAESTRVFLEMSSQIRSVLTIDQWRNLVRRSPEMQKRHLDTQVEP